MCFHGTYFCNVSIQRQVYNFIFDAIYLIIVWLYGFSIMHSCTILIICCLCLSYYNMGILAKWGETTYFFSVGYYVMHLFFGVCVSIFFLLWCFCCWSFLIFCYHNLVLFFNRACQSSLIFFVIVKGCFQNVLMGAYVIWLELFNLSKHQHGLIYILVGLLMGFVIYWVFVWRWNNAFTNMEVRKNCPLKWIGQDFYIFIH